jgi:hypothetical protein
VEEEFEAAASELVKVAQPPYCQDLGEVLESAQYFPPNKLANLLVERSPETNFHNLQYGPPLEPLKAFLRVLTSDGRLFLNPMSSRPLREAKPHRTKLRSKQH